MSIRSLTLSLLALVFLGPIAALAQKPSEMPGAKDHPLISRYAGSILQNTAQENFAAIRVPAGPGRYGPDSKLLFDKAVTVEGKLASYFYIAPRDKTALEVFRNYQAALQSAGFQTLYRCEMAECDQALIREGLRREVLEPRPWGKNRGSPESAVDRDVRFLSAKVTRQGVDVAVMVFVAEPNSVWQAPAVVVLVAEPAPVETGKIVVNTDALKRGLADEGRVVLYAIYFDTGKAQIKPESKPQLDEMARLLDADKALKVLIVGHTDNQGTIDANLDLSQRRAQAIVAALSTQYKVDARRLLARGVANFAPIASNAGEAGRAKNRRVEMVTQ